MKNKLILSMLIISTSTAFAAKNLLRSLTKSPALTIQIFNATGIELSLFAASAVERNKDDHLCHHARTLLSGKNNHIKFKNLDSLAKILTHKFEPTGSNYFILTPADFGLAEEPSESEGSNEYSRPSTPAVSSDYIPAKIVDMPLKHTKYIATLVAGKIQLTELAED